MTTVVRIPPTSTTLVRSSPDATYIVSIGGTRGPRGPRGIGAGSFYLDDLVDVDAANPLNLQVLGWDGANWIPVDQTGGSGVPTGGLTDQALLKDSNADGDADWRTLTATLVGADPAGTATAEVATHVGLADPHTQYQKESERNAANGYAPLDASGLLPTANLPPLAITNVFTVADQTAMLALTAETGDVAYRTDTSTFYILTASPASTLGNWIQLTAPQAVISVDGRTGVVTLSDLYDVLGAAAAAQAFAIQRANHTGSQVASTISDFSEAVDDRINGLIIAGAAISKTYDDTGNTYTLDVSVDGVTVEVSGDALRIKDKGVTFAKIQDIGEATVIGREAGTGTGSPTEVPVETLADVASELLDAIKTVDGNGSGLDADLLDGISSTGFDTAGAAAAAQAASQPLDADLTAIAALTTTSFGRSVLTQADASALRTLAGLVIGTNVQAWDADLDAIAALTTTSFGRGLLALADAAALRTSAGLGTIATAAATDYAKLAFGTTDQTFSTTAGGRVAVEAYTAGGGTDNEIRLCLYLNSTDTQPAWTVATLFNGALVLFALGPGGTTAPDTPYARKRANVPMTNFPANANKPFIGRLNTSMTAVGNVGAGEDNLQTFTLPASSLLTDEDQISAHWYGTFANNANAKTLKVYFGTTDITNGGIALPTSVAGHWQVELWVMRTGAATQDCVAIVSYNTATTTKFSTADATLTSSAAVKCTGEATSNNDIVSEIQSVDFYPTPTGS